MQSRKWPLAIACASVALASCGGGGGGGGSSSGGSGGSGSGTGSGTGGNAGSSTNVLFATDYTHGTVAGFDTLTPSGETWGDHVLVTVPGGGQSIAWDTARDELYVLVDWLGSPAVHRVDVYAHASTMQSGATPARSITLSNLNETDAIVLDTPHDRLWIAGMRTNIANDGGELDVFEHASTLNGTPAADRRIVNIESIRNMALDTTRSILYTIGGVRSWEAYAYVDTDSMASGAVPAFYIPGPGSFGIALDATRDILYMPDTTKGLTIVHGASTAASATTITVPFAGTPVVTATVDSARDRLYLGAYTQAFVIDNASTLASTASLPARAASAPTGASYPVSIWSFASH